MISLQLSALRPCLGFLFASIIILSLFCPNEAGLIFGDQGLIRGIGTKANETLHHRKDHATSPQPQHHSNASGNEQSNATLILGNRTVENKPYQSCKSIHGSAGHCRHLRFCLIDAFLENSKLIDELSCTISNRYIGVCCPDQGEHNQSSSAQGRDSGKNVEGRVVFGLPKRQKPPAVIEQASPLGPPGRNIGCGVNALENSSPTTDIEQSDPGEYPWMAALVRLSDGEQFCGGTLLDQIHILTAAHCFRSVKLDELYVVLGEYDLTSPNETRSQVFNATRLVVHGQYDPATYENDIAVLRLNRPAIFNTYVWPMCLPDFEDMRDAVNRSAIVTGWGMLYDGGPASTVLLEVAVPIWDNEFCQEHYAQVILDTAICAAAYQGGKDSCRGDSGGPLMLQKRDGRWAIVGIVSFGVSCGLPLQPGVYTRVIKYLPWIIKYTQV